MLGLALDFAGPEGQVAISNQTDILFRASRSAGPGTVEGIVPFTLSAIEQAGLTAGDIDIIVATTGPGSFTGIRAGLAAAHGLGLAFSRPVIGRTVFDAIALSLAADQYPVLVALDGRRADLFVQLIAGGVTEPHEPANIPPDQLEGLCPAGSLFLAGSAADQAFDGLRQAGRPANSLTVLESCRQVDIGLLAQSAASTPPAQHGQIFPKPFYGRAPDARPRQ